METSKDIEEVSCKGRKQGGWITFPYIAGTMLGLVVGTSGATSNLMVYLMKEYHVKSIDAAQINNIISGCISLAPVAGAIISDSLFGCYPVIAFSTFVNLLSMVLFMLTATVKSLRPTQCTNAGSINNCDPPSPVQLTVLYSAVALLSIAAGGTRSTLMTLGADQFDQIKDQDSFFNWYFVIMYASSIFGATVIVYIQDSISWGLGFGICVIACFVSIVALMVGQKYYQRVKTRGSPFISLARVIVAAIRKRKVEMAVEDGTNFYYGTVEGVKSVAPAPSRKLRFLNRAAIITRGDTYTDGSVKRPWNLCTVEQVEDLKTLLRISPLWTSSIFLSISIGIQLSLSILQALTMDRTIGHHFSIPPGSVVVFSLTTVALVLPIIDRVLIPLCHWLTTWTPSPLQRLGLGHVLNAGAMAASGLVEKRRASIVLMHRANGNPDWVVPMSVLWLVLPLAMAGLGEALHFPGQVSLYYQEFPNSLKSTATGMVALIIAIGFYASTAVVGLARKITRWLPDNINDSKMDNVFWMVAVIGAINFGYYVLCATLYKYHSRNVQEEAAPVNNTTT